MIFANAGGVSAYAGALAEKKQTNIGFYPKKYLTPQKW
jgi:hypothetical protein